MKRILITLALWICFTTTATATEILMFSMKSCGYCQKFIKEVAQEYNNSEHAKLLPLRIISMDRKNAPKWFDQAYTARKIDGIVGTPTFIVWDGEERARLIGYQGKERFLDDITRFIDNNRKQLSDRVGQDKIPFEKETEMLPKQALQEIMGGAEKTSEGSHSKQPEPFVPFQPELTTPPKYEGKSENPHTGKLQKFPNGVFKSRDIMDHQYKTNTEAQTAANFLGCLGTHTHLINGKTVHMPCKME
tara:strand:+ start:1587 stop:2327 length:741 start_codon:yes stop_codon:yes gene_type:complete